MLNIVVRYMVPEIKRMFGLSISTWVVFETLSTNEPALRKHEEV